jgi:hypothetical protein
MPDTIASARAELFELLASDDKGTPRSDVLELIHRTELAPGEAIVSESGIVTIAYAGQAPFFYRFALRIYVGLNAGAEFAQDAMDEAIEAVEALLNSTFGVSEWSDMRFIQPPVGNAAIYVETVLECGRETGGLPT